MENQLCPICQNWAREHSHYYPAIKGKDSHFVITNHHITCPHFNDSLIDVWKVSYDGAFYYSDKPPCAEETESGETVTQEKMHREVFEQLPEFNGF